MTYFDVSLIDTFRRYSIFYYRFLQLLWKLQWNICDIAILLLLYTQVIQQCRNWKHSIVDKFKFRTEFLKSWGEGDLVFDYSSKKIKIINFVKKNKWFSHFFSSMCSYRHHLESVKISFFIWQQAIRLCSSIRKRSFGNDTHFSIVMATSAYTRFQIYTRLFWTRILFLSFSIYTANTPVLRARFWKL